jgi:hypothetical protein
MRFIQLIETYLTHICFLFARPDYAPDAIAAQVA